MRTSKQISPSLIWDALPRSPMGKMSKEVPRPLFSIWKVSHTFVLVIDIFPSLCSAYRTLFYFHHLLVIFSFSFSRILVITKELLLLLDHTVSAQFYGLLKIFIPLTQTLLTFKFLAYNLTIHDTRTTKTIASIAEHKYKTWQLLCLHDPTPIIPINEVSLHRRSVHNCIPHLKKFPHSV